MVNFDFSAINNVLARLFALIWVSAHNMKFENAPGDADSSDDPKELGALTQANDAVLWIVDTCDKRFVEFYSAHIVDSTKRLRYWLKHKPQKWSELNILARSLSRILQTELGQQLYYRYPKQKAEKLLMWRSDWEKAVVAFPGIRLDVFSAVDCYSLQHNTASVFHCMRILENGLGVLAKDVDLNFDFQQWNTIIEQIESKINKIRRSSPQGPEKSKRMQFLSEAAKEFYYFKDGWRNYVSHNRADYDENQAAGVIEHTRAFMNHLSTQLSE